MISTVPSRVKRIAGFLVFALLTPLVGPERSRAHDLVLPQHDAARHRTADIDGMTLWLRARFSEAELEGFRPGELALEPHFCGCYDQPNKHFPYRLVLLKTPKGDLVTRPERRGISVTFTALAVRYADRYCEVDSDENCYGSFSEPCEFTDFRYGPYLAEFFPTCKSADGELAVTPRDSTRVEP